MTRIAVVYHSGFGHTEKLANQVAQGIRDESGTAKILPISAGKSDFSEIFLALEDVHAIIFGTPTYMGSVSGPMKNFMDASAGTFFAQGWKDKIGAGFTVSGSPSGDKLNTLTTLAIFAAQHGMLWIGPAQSPGNNDDTAAATDIENRLGSFIGAMAQAANDSAEVTPKSGDLAFARSLGRRVTVATNRWQSGSSNIKA